MNKKYLQGISVLIGLLIVITSITSSASANHVQWCDGFEDGTCDDWTVILGDWEVTDGYLKSQPRTGTKIIAHDSFQVEGTWSFDVFHESCYAGFETVFMFMASGTDIHGCYGYGILLSGDSFYFVKQDGDITTLESLGFVSATCFENTWTHFDVTRNSTTFEFKVYINATSNVANSDISVIDADHITSEEFAIRGVGCDCYLDYVVTDERFLITELPAPTTINETTSSDTTPSTLEDEPLTLDPVLLALGVGAVAVLVILIATINLKKR
ncbi:MAG: hypothetical protein ACTSSE_13475 [Candidatus Thorarchaeota archaeon]